MISFYLNLLKFLKISQYILFTMITVNKPNWKQCCESKQTLSVSKHICIMKSFYSISI